MEKEYKPVWSARQGDFRRRVIERRERLREYSDILTKGGLAERAADDVEKVVSDFREQNGDQIKIYQGKLERISSISGDEIVLMFDRAFSGYAMAARKHERKKNGKLSNDGLFNTLKQDLPLFLFDFGVLVKKMSAGKKRIAKMDKELIVKTAKKNNPQLIGQLYNDPNISEVFCRTTINRALLLDGNAGDTLSAALPYIEQGAKMLHSAGINSYSGHRKFLSFVNSKCAYKDSIERMDNFLHELQRCLTVVPYIDFELEFLKETQDSGSLHKNLISKLQTRLIIPDYILNIYLANYFDSIFVNQKANKYITEMGKDRRKRFRGEVLLEKVGKDDEGYDKVEWNKLLGGSFPGSVEHDLPDAIEQLQRLSIPEEKILRLVSIVKRSSHDPKNNWNNFKYIIFMDFSSVNPDILNLLRNEFQE